MILGNGSGYYLTGTSNNNIIIGNNSFNGASENDLNASVLFGHNITNTSGSIKNNVVVLGGNVDVTDDNVVILAGDGVQLVGIRNTNPQYVLDVTG
ncbi:MAG: hypothetical protein GW928_08970, partial [Rhodoferax sp.]|nr:hypothetical protein [Rhodoferax sp.]